MLLIDRSMDYGREHLFILYNHVYPVIATFIILQPFLTLNIFYFFLEYEGKLQSSSLPYNRRETRDKWPLGRDPDRGLYHLHTRVKLFWSQSMIPWTSAAAYECAAAQSMDP